VTLPHGCGICADILHLLSALVLTTAERAEILRRSEESLRETTVTLASRGYVQFPDGHWGWLEPKKIQ
jgi:hypothetical protein